MNPQEFEKWKGEASDKYGFRVPYDGSNNFYDDKAIKHFEAGADAAYNLLSKQLSEKDEYSEAVMKENFILQGKCDALNEEWLTRMTNSSENYLQEIERLKGLIKEGFVLLQHQWNKTLGQIDTDWAKFQKENKL